MKTLVLFAALSSVLFLSQARAETASIASDPWSSYMEALRPVGEKLAARLSDPNDPRQRNELYKLLYSTIVFGYFSSVYQDIEHPDFWPFFDNQIFSFLFPNPDNIYHMALIDPKGVYRIRGFRGTTRIVNIEAAGGTMYRDGVGGLPEFGPTYANFDLDHDVHLAKDGSYNVILSAERPDAYTGDWWQLPPKTVILVVRQMNYDWVNEVNGGIAIARLDTPARKSPSEPDDMAARLKRISTFAEEWTRASLDWRDMLRKSSPMNTIRVNHRKEAGNMEDQRYIDGLFDVASDEALILETEVPQSCRYWSFQLTNEFIVSLDAMHRQSSLNGHTGRLDADGKFRAVISGTDPGVPNWLDTAGNTTGSIYGRWKSCSGYPTPTIRKVRLAEVRKHLPADTPTVTPEAREEAIRLRTLGAQLRRRW